MRAPSQRYKKEMIMVGVDGIAGHLCYRFEKR